MDLVRDVLDARLVDRRGRSLGRVDGILLDVRDGRPPRFVAMEVGLVTAARRIHPRLARWVRAFAIKVLPVPVRPTRYSPRLCRDIGVDVKLDVDAQSDARLLRLEKWLRRHVVERIPGAGE
ncbi:MAG: hypothetical protein DMG04_15705 [Acidobacteria bacterium]|nr:MAG: hypothetical protein DMG04_15705 [Acidobacteriota bacterium]PYQ87903.1 MAG: hypothetical protein DMG02_19885 [Acidobacteriota bacterium]PYR02985.1 MAG: hypothetical protein DMG00_27620 [Acidobacteriota bacterium]